MPQDLHLTDIRSYHVGGQLRTLQGIPVQEHVRVPGQPPVRIDMNGDYMVGQLYVQHFRLAHAHAWPVILMHGGSLTGACWESTPDGAEGWLTRLLRAGHDVLLVDAFERGRAGWPHVPSVLPSPAPQLGCNLA